MAKQFQGQNGRRKLIEVLMDQKLVQHNIVIAEKLADVVKVNEVPEGKQLYVQDEPGNNVLFLVLSGNVDIKVEDQCITTLGPGQFFGEFPILDPSMKYTVSAITNEKSLIASLTEQKIVSIASTYPEVWRNMAKELATRLRNTSTSRPKKPESTLNAAKPAELSIGALLKNLTTPEIYKAAAAVVTALAAVAAVSYNLGAHIGS